MPRIPTFAAAFILLAAITPDTSTAQNCAPPPNYAPSAVPSLTPAAHAKLSYTVSDTIQVPLPEFQRWFDAVPLQDLLPGTRDIPAVLGTHVIGSPQFPSVGATRYVCLADGSAAVERVLAAESQQRFEYVVWDYTLSSARALRYGHGLFQLAPLGEFTVVRWTYSFMLADDRLPGRLGPLGRWLFRRTFLEPKYGPFMQVGMRAIRQRAERAFAMAKSD